MSLNSYGHDGSQYLGPTTLPPLSVGIKNTIMDERYPDATLRAQFASNPFSGRYANTYSMSSVGTSSFYVNYEQQYCNQYVAHLTQDSTAQYFQRFKDNSPSFTYDTILYSGNKRSLGRGTDGLRASSSHEPNPAYRDYKMAFWPDHSNLRSSLGANYTMTGKFKNETELNNYNTEASGVQGFTEFNFKFSLDGINTPVSKPVDLSYFGISGSVTKIDYINKQAAIDAGQWFDTDITQRGSIISNSYFDPNAASRRNRGSAPIDSYNPDSGRDPDNPTTSPPTTPPPTTAPPTTTTFSPTTTTTGGAATTAPPPDTPTPPSVAPPTTNPPPNVC